MKKYFFPVFSVCMLSMLTLIFFLAKPEQGTRMAENQDVPNDWMTSQRAYPNGVIKTQSLIDGMMQAKELRDNSPQMRSGWQFAGPTNIGGRITDIEVPAATHVGVLLFLTVSVPL